MIFKKKILIVSNGFYPEISPRSFRATELAKAFCNQGHDVTVFSKFRKNDYTSFLSKYPIHFSMWGPPNLHPLPDIKSKPLSYIRNILARLLLLFFEYPAIEDMFKVHRILKNQSGYDLMISFAVPHPVHWGAAWAVTKKNKPARIWVADCGDPYMGNILDRFKKPFYFGFFEKWFCRKADYITVPIKSAIEGYYPEFHNKIRIIPQGFDFDLNALTNEFQKNEVPAFAYAGGFLPGVRDPAMLLQFLSELEIPFRFYIYTGDIEILNDYREKLNGKLIISDYIPREELMKILAGMDFLINFDNGTRLNSPSKLIDYAIVNRPVLNIQRDFRAEVMMEFLEGNYDKQMQLPDPRYFHIDRITQSFLDLLL